MYKSRKSEGLIEKVYLCLTSNIPLDSIHIPHSDVFYVREALESRFKRDFSLEQTEEYMKEAGWSERPRESEEQDEGVGA